MINLLFSVYVSLPIDYYVHFPEFEGSSVNKTVVLYFEETGTKVTLDFDIPQHQKEEPEDVEEQDPGESENDTLWNGSSATLTWFDDTVFQCGTYEPGTPIVAINPKLIGITDQEWLSLYANASPENIPWCNKQMDIVLNGVSMSFVIGDTCSPTGPTAEVPNQGGKCDYDDVIDIHNGSDLLNSLVGGGFYQGAIEWRIY